MAFVSVSVCTDLEQFMWAIQSLDQITIWIIVPFISVCVSFSISFIPHTHTQIHVDIYGISESSVRASLPQKNYWNVNREESVFLAWSSNVSHAATHSCSCVNSDEDRLHFFWIVDFCVRRAASVCVCDEMFELLKTGSEREEKKNGKMWILFVVCWKEWTFELNAYTFCGSSFGWRRQSERCARACMHAKRQDEMMGHNGLNALTHTHIHSSHASYCLSIWLARARDEHTMRHQFSVKQLIAAFMIVDFVQILPPIYRSSHWIDTTHDHAGRNHNNIMILIIDLRRTYNRLAPATILVVCTL